MIGILFLSANLIILGITLCMLVINLKQLASGRGNACGKTVPAKTLERFGISQREKEIALAILEGKTNNEIAEEKLISLATVKKHVYNLFQKTDSHNRIEFINRLRGTV